MPLGAPGFWLLAAVFAANMLAFAVLSVHLIPLLVESAVFDRTGRHPGRPDRPHGRSQGRVVEYTFGRRFSAAAAGLMPLAMLPVALLLLIRADTDFVMLGIALGLYGASNGVMTIVRAVVPAELFGRERYATLNGALSVPVILTRAAGPVGIDPLGGHRRVHRHAVGPGPGLRARNRCFLAGGGANVSNGRWNLDELCC